MVRHPWRPLHQTRGTKLSQPCWHRGQAAGEFPAVTLSGPRQNGKPTLCRHVFAELPSYLQGIIDADPRPGRWILTGSQDLALLESVSQSLAGRSAVLHLLPLAWGEVLRFDRRPRSLEEAVVTGGYPAILDRGLSRATGWAPMLPPTSNATCGRSATSAIWSPSSVSSNTASGGCRSSSTTPHWPRTAACPSPDQFRSHPLRGPLCESRVVGEVLKQRTNLGESGGLSFYRDRDGAEADLVVERAGGLTLVEARADQTPSPSLFAGVRRVRRHLEEPSRPCDVVVTCGGDEVQTRSAGELLPWDRLHEREWGR